MSAGVRPRPVPEYMIEGMNISDFFNTYPGVYVAEAVFHSLIAAVIVDRSIQAWRIKDPLIKQRFRSIVVVLPVFSFPLYQLLNPERTLADFRLRALLDLNRWLTLELWDMVPVSLLFLLVLLTTALVFLFQEIIPILTHSLESRNAADQWHRPGEDSAVYKALQALPGESPDVFMIDDDEHILFSTSGREAAVFLSTGLLSVLGLGELRAALAHEIAHINRSKRPIILMLFFFRILMFFNPVVLVEFRRIVQEDEMICDDIAVSLTGDSRALADTLRKLYHDRDGIDGGQGMKEAIEHYSHHLLIESRIRRLEEEAVRKPQGCWFEFALTLSVIMVINYFVV